MLQFSTTHIVNWLVVILLSTLLVSAEAYRGPLILLAVASLAYFIYYWAYQKWQPSCPNNVVTPWLSRCLIATFIGYFLSYVFFFLYHQEDLRHLDMPSKFVGFSLLLFFLMRYPVRYQLLFLGINLAAIIGGIVAIGHVYYLNYDAAFTYMMKIQTGDIAMSLGLLSGLITLYYQEKKSPWVYFSALATLLGVGASFLSETRGAWVCLPLLLIYALWRYRCRIGYKMYLIIGGVVVFFVIYFFYINPIPRIQHAISDITHYAQDNKNTSVGIRFELWKSAVYSWQEKPFLGWGEQAIFSSQVEQAKQGLIDAIIPEKQFHAHNQYFEELSRRGLVGVLAFLSLLCIPLVAFYQTRQQQSPEIKLLANMGILHIFLISTYCLTQAFFAHHSGVIFYLLILVTIAAAITGVNKEKSKLLNQSPPYNPV